MNNQLINPFPAFRTRKYMSSIIDQADFGHEESDLLDITEDLLEKNPVDTEALRLKSRLLSEQGNLREAVDNAIITNALEPDNQVLCLDLARHRFNLAVELSDQEQISMFRLAKADFEKTIKLSGSDSYLHTMLGCVALAIEDYSEAEIQFDIALKIDPRSGVAHFMKGKLLFKQSNFRQAEKYLKASYKLDDRFKAESEDMLNIIGKYGETVPEEDPELWKDLLLGFSSLIFTSVLAVLPTLVIWLVIDSITGYFPPFLLVILSIPILPLTAFLFYNLFIRDMFASVAKSKASSVSVV